MPSRALPLAVANCVLSLAVFWLPPQADAPGLPLLVVAAICPVLVLLTGHFALRELDDPRRGLWAKVALALIAIPVLTLWTLRQALVGG